VLSKLSSECGTELVCEVSHNDTKPADMRRNDMQASDIVDRVITKQRIHVTFLYIPANLLTFQQECTQPDSIQVLLKEEQTWCL